MEPSSVTLGVLAKRPRPGEVKTRLAMELGEERACECYEQWLEGWFTRLNESGMDWVLFVDPGRSRGWFRDRYPLQNISLVEQPDGDLGNRMLFAQHWLQNEMKSGSVLLGSDAPDLPIDWIARGIELQRENEVLVGPARDGGYYLIGTDGPTPNLFRGMRWSRRDVLRRTLNRIELTDRSALMLPEWRDIDVLQDWRAFLRRTDDSWEQYFDLN